MHLEDGEDSNRWVGRMLHEPREGGRENIVIMFSFRLGQVGKQWRELGKLKLYGVTGVAYQLEQPVLDLRNEMPQKIMEQYLENKWEYNPCSLKKGKKRHSESYGKATASSRPGASNVSSKGVTGTERTKRTHRRHPTGCTKVCSGLSASGWVDVGAICGNTWLPSCWGQRVLVQCLN